MMQVRRPVRAVLSPLASGLLATGVLATGVLMGTTSGLNAQQHKELGRMWTFENAPLDFFQEEYDFRPSTEWLDHARLSALRYGGGCSASFVSSKGLIMTNHHCARDHVEEVTPDGEDWLKTGFYAGSLAGEVQVPSLTVQQLVSTLDVTKAMNEGMHEDMSEAERTAKLESNQEALLASSKEKHADLDHEMVAMYQGGMYQIYSYKIYNDIRLVAVPHLQIAKFGGDPDNFTFPRFSLDYAFVRAYEDGKPADTSDHYFRFKTEGPKNNETVFVIGNPGSTGRMDTIAQMEFLRDVQYPGTLNFVRQRLKGWNDQLAEDPSKEQELRGQILQFENVRKAYQGYLDGLLDENVMNIKREAEKRLRDKIESDDSMASYRGAYERIEELVAQKRELIDTVPRGELQGKMEEMAKSEAANNKVIGDAFFAAYGTSIPPDATFTLRISDGRVKGFPMNGTVAPWFTSLYGLYARNCEFGNEDPFDLPIEWLLRANSMDMTTRFNMVSTCDIISGNSGSPMIDADLNVVGLVFDGNIESLGNRFVFTDDVPRTVCVHPAIIVESLRKIYDAGRLADELIGAHTPITRARAVSGDADGDEDKEHDGHDKDEGGEHKDGDRDGSEEHGKEEGGEHKGDGKSDR